MQAAKADAYADFFKSVQELESTFEKQWAGFVTAAQEGLDRAGFEKSAAEVQRQAREVLGQLEAQRQAGVEAIKSAGTVEEVEKIKAEESQILAEEKKILEEERAVEETLATKVGEEDKAAAEAKVAEIEKAVDAKEAAIEVEKKDLEREVKEKEEEIKAVALQAAPAPAPQAPEAPPSPPRSPTPAPPPPPTMTDLGGTFPEA